VRSRQCGIRQDSAWWKPSSWKGLLCLLQSRWSDHTV
ncbi:uncharacterized protein METZ01_LOCUS96456, partial [marine metagenome]